jgi:hypothetical protein
MGIISLAAGAPPQAKRVEAKACTTRLTDEAWLPPRENPSKLILLLEGN